MAAYEHQPKGAGEGHVSEPTRPKDDCCLVPAGEAAKAKKRASATLHRLRPRGFADTFAFNDRLRLWGSADTFAFNGRLWLRGSADTFASNDRLWLGGFAGTFSSSDHLRLRGSADFYGFARATTLGLGTSVDILYSGQLRLEGFVGQDLDVKGSWETFGNRCNLYFGYLDYFRARRLKRGLALLKQRR